MNLNYEKIKTKIEHGGNAWTSYSDLFLVLSVIFLLLYVMSSLRTSTASIVAAQSYKQAKEENEVLKKQLGAYEVLKDEYMKRGASEEQMAMYQQMVKRLDLLGEESAEERKRLEMQTRDLNEKEKALNQYQQMMKSMINASMVAQGRMHLRELNLKEHEKRIEEKDKSISALNQTLAEKQGELTTREAEIARTNQQIEAVQDKLKKSLQEINYAYRSKKKSQEAMKAEAARLKQESEAKIAELREKNNKDAQQLKVTQEHLETKNRELETTIGSLRDKEQEFSQMVEKAKKDHEARMAAMKAQREKFDKELAAERLSAEEKLKRQKAYLASVEQERVASDNRLKQAREDLEGTQKNLHSMEANYQKTLSTLARSNDTLKKDLKETLSRKADRRKLAQKISSALGKAGISAVVDKETGEVTVQFIEDYFDYGKAEIKPKMKSQLDQFFPAYSAALFDSDGGKIASVDIVGFASPTFRGKFVNPDSLHSGDRAAVNFNMDLSYQRAKAIFAYVFDTTKIQFTHQKDLLGLVRVTGRSYLAERKDGSARAPASVKPEAQEYCQVFDCQKSQRVIIKFNLKEE